MLPSKPASLPSLPTAAPASISTARAALDHSQLGANIPLGCPARVISSSHSPTRSEAQIESSASVSLRQARFRGTAVWLLLHSFCLPAATVTLFWLLVFFLSHPHSPPQSPPKVSPKSPKPSTFVLSGDKKPTGPTASALFSRTPVCWLWHLQQKPIYPPSCLAAKSIHLAADHLAPRGTSTHSSQIPDAQLALPPPRTLSGISAASTHSNATTFKHQSNSTIRI
jgi:hypothetical protein